MQPWKCVCVDLIGHNSIKAKEGTVLDLICITMIDLSTEWFKIIELPNLDITDMHKGEEIREVIINKSCNNIILVQYLVVEFLS